MTTSKENANPNVMPYAISLKGLTIVQVLWKLSEAGFTVDASKTTMWDHCHDRRCNEFEPDPPVFVVWINDGEAEKLTVIQTSDKEQVLTPGMDLHYFVPPLSVAGDAEWYAIRSGQIMK